jgi:hypothetical protein
MNFNSTFKRAALVVAWLSSALACNAQPAAAPLAEPKPAAQVVGVDRLATKAQLHATPGHAKRSLKPHPAAPRGAKSPFGVAWIWYSDARLKRDITLLEHRPDGLGLYAYRYVWSDTVYVGVMAQEVVAVMPDAVATDADGHLKVNYRALGMELLTLEQWVAAQRH